MGKLDLFSIFLAMLLSLFLLYLITNQIKEPMNQTDPLLEHAKVILEPLNPRIKNIKMYSSDKSYTINKETIYICVKDKNGDYYPLNMILFVILHELAHYFNTKDVGHTEEFHRIFDELLAQASAMGIYTPEIPVIDNYSA